MAYYRVTFTFMNGQRIQNLCLRLKLITVIVNSYYFFVEVFKMRKIVSSSVPGHYADFWMTIDVSKETAAPLYHEKRGNYFLSKVRDHLPP
jgi:hypothetical protein